MSTFRAIVAVAGAGIIIAGAVAPALAYVQTPIYRSQGGVTEVGDPENAANDVVEFTTTAGPYPAGIASVTRDLRSKGIQVDDLTNMLATKYFFVDRTCAGGSPRFQILIDTDGNGTANGNAFGYLGDRAFGGSCVPGLWVYEDMASLSNPAPKWDITQFGGGPANTWAQVVAFFAANFPNHKVMACGLFDDSGSFAPTAVGHAYFDNVQCFDRVLEDHQDVSPGTAFPF